MTERARRSATESRLRTLCIISTLESAQKLRRLPEIVLGEVGDARHQIARLDDAERASNIVYEDIQPAEAVLHEKGPARRERRVADAVPGIKTTLVGAGIPISAERASTRRDGDFDAGAYWSTSARHAGRLSPVISCASCPTGSSVQPYSSALRCRADATVPSANVTAAP